MTDMTVSNISNPTKSTIKELTQLYAPLFSWVASSSSIPRNDDRWEIDD